MKDLSIEERLAKVETLLSLLSNKDILFQPISTWVLSTDRHLPQSFLCRQLGDFLAITCENLRSSPGVGDRKISKLIEVLERTVELPSAIKNSDHLATILIEKANLVQKAESFSPEKLTEAEWQVWCSTIQAHRLEHENLGRFAGSLADLPQGLWTVPLSEYIFISLSEVRKKAGYGQARVGQVLEVFYRVSQTISNCRTDSPLSIRILSPHVRDMQLWIEKILQDKLFPSVQELRDGFLGPLFSLLKLDLGSETADIISRRIGLYGSAETLEHIGSDIGLTRERVRQIALKAVKVTQARWPEGRYILDNIYSHFRLVPDSEEQLELLHSILDVCFAMEVTRGSSRAEILAAWDRAARAKRTPMTEANLRLWAADEFPDQSPNVIKRWLAEEGLRHTEKGGEILFFSNDPLDKVLLHLHANPDPVPVDELSDFVVGDERNIRNRLDRDPRFIEDEFKRVLRAEQCSFFRCGSIWFIRLDPIPQMDLEPRAQSISISDMIHLLLGGLIQAGICDATVWGVHRLMISMLKKVYSATLSPFVTPFVLASTLVRHSEGIIRPMRRRRLRWDSGGCSVPVRGKRGWVDHIMSTAGIPMTLDELDSALRGFFQDYEPYVLRQLNLNEDEEGEAGFAYQFLPGVSNVVPTIIIPGGWELDLTAVNVSEGVQLAVSKIVSMSTREPFPKHYLRRVPWLIQLCEHAAFGKMRWEEREESIAEEDHEDKLLDVSNLQTQEEVGPKEESQVPKCQESHAVEDILSRFF